MKTITLEVPDELLELIGLRNDSLSRDALNMIVLELYREEVISLGKAAQLSGLSIDGFMEFSSIRKVPMHYSNPELQEDRLTLHSKMP